MAESLGRRRRRLRTLSATGSGAFLRRRGVEAVRDVDSEPGGAVVFRLWLPFSTICVSIGVSVLEWRLELRDLLTLTFLPVARERRRVERRRLRGCFRRDWRRLLDEF